jgi:hypothetical protein
VQHWLRTVDDTWLHVRGEAVLGELAHPAPVRRCRRPPRSCRGNVATSRLPADRGVSTVRSRTSAVPGR